MKRSLIAAVTVGMVGAGTSALVTMQPAAAAGQHVYDLVAQAPTTYLLAKPCDDCVLDEQPQGAHIGATEYDSGALTERGRTVGHFGFVAMGITPFNGEDHPGELQLLVTAVIDGDQLVGQGLEEPPLNGGVLAITGGTGRFARARGIVRYSDNDDGSTNLHIDLQGDQ